MPGLRVFAVGLLLMTAPPVQSQETPSDTLLTMQHYLNWEQVSDPQIAPDGSKILYTRRQVNQMEDKWESAIHLMNADGTQPRFLLRGSGARWSPDGTRILYIADGQPSGTQIFVRWMDSEGAVTQITRLTEAPINPRWSPDGKSIAFAMLVPEKKPSITISLPPRPDGAKWTAEPRVVERLNYRMDRLGFLPDGFTHLFVVSAEGGTPRQLTSGAWNVGARTIGLPVGVGLDWTPDGSSIVFDGFNAADADLMYRESYIYSAEVASGTMRQLVDLKGVWSGPTVSPDGRTVAFVGYPWTRQTHKTQELHVVGIDGKGMRSVSADFDRDPANLVWASDGSGLYALAEDHGSRNLFFLSLRGAARPVTKGSQVLQGGTLARTGVFVSVRSSPHEPGDVVRFALDNPTQLTELTHVNDDVLERIKLGQVEEIWYNSTEGARIQGWLVKPPSFNPAKKYPLVMEIHGGPHGMYNVGFDYWFQNFAANGYVVIYTNPRGSTGYGTAFGNAIDQGYPSVDYDDLMAGVDAALAKGYIDPNNLFVGGCSGGGVLSSWVVGHTTRFAGAAVRCPVVNWLSFAGTTDVALPGFYGYGLYGFPWEKPEKHLKHSSLMYVANVKTPTIIMTGELDLRTPMSQSEEFYQALKVLKVPTALVRFPAEAHSTRSIPSNFLRTQLYMLAWYKRYARPPGGGATP